MKPVELTLKVEIKPTNLNIQAKSKTHKLKKKIEIIEKRHRLLQNEAPKTLASKDLRLK